MTGPERMTVPRGNELCVHCGVLVGLHDGVMAIDCLIKLAQAAQP